MQIVTIDDVKLHCRIDDDAEDTLLAAYAESAEATVLNILNRPLESLYEEYGDIPRPIWHAVLLLTAESYKNREESSPTQLYRVSYNVDAMVKPYMRLTI